MARGYVDGRSRLPFELVLRAQMQLVKLGFMRRRAFPVELDLLDHFVAELGVQDPAELEKARREFCLATWIVRTRRHFMKLPIRRQGAWLKLAPEVASTLRGGALLVGAHFGCGMLTPLALAQLGIEIVAIVHTPSATLRPKFVRALDISKQDPMQAVVEARAILRRGGVVFLAGDVATRRPGGNVEVDVLGRRRRFARGFAELSISSSVPPTPVFSRVDQAGKVFTWVEPPLAAPDSGDREERVAALIRAYADRLTANFARHPGNVSPDAIRAFFARG
jgi:hypothetical protein